MPAVTLSRRSRSSIATAARCIDSACASLPHRVQRHREIPFHGADVIVLGRKLLPDDVERRAKQSHGFRETPCVEVCAGAVVELLGDRPADSCLAISCQSRANRASKRRATTESYVTISRSFVAARTS